MGCCCCGNESTKILYSCSGSADVGELTDRIWRKLKAEGAGTGSCLAAVGADLSGFVASARDADVAVVLDGCPTGCGKKIFESKGLPCRQIVMTELGVEKGRTEVTDQLVSDMSDKVWNLIL